jgi:hypothetical protein
VLGLLEGAAGRVVSRYRAVDGEFTEIQVLEFACEEVVERFRNDPRRTALGDAREASIATTTVVRVESLA